MSHLEVPLVPDRISSYPLIWDICGRAVRRMSERRRALGLRSLGLGPRCIRIEIEIASRRGSRAARAREVAIDQSASQQWPT
jgi:hypothetical protein